MEAESTDTVAPEVDNAAPPAEAAPARDRSPSPRRRSRSRSHSRSPRRSSDRHRSRSRSRSRSPRRESPARARDAVDPARVDDGFKLYVGNLDFRTTEDELRERFRDFGELLDVFIPRDRQRHGSRGFAFVTYVKEADAEYAEKKMDGRDFQGRALQVNFAKPRPPPMRGYGGGGGVGGRGGGGGGGGGGMSNEICRDFQRGDCFRGSNCRYSHDDRRGGGGGGYDRGGYDRGGYDRGGYDRGYDRGGDRGGYDRDYDRGGDRDRDRDRGYDRDRHRSRSP